jgi:hypothetical protein
VLDSYPEERETEERPMVSSEPDRWGDRVDEGQELMEASDVEAEEIDDVEDDKPEPVEDDYDIMDEEDPYADWNIPSWQELIASLYRPER